MSGDCLSVDHISVDDLSVDHISGDDIYVDVLYVVDMSVDNPSVDDLSVHHISVPNVGVFVFTFERGVFSVLCFVATLGFLSLFFFRVCALPASAVLTSNICR